MIRSILSTPETTKDFKEDLYSQAWKYKLIFPSLKIQACKPFVELGSGWWKKFCISKLTYNHWACDGGSVGKVGKASKPEVCGWITSSITLNIYLPIVTKKTYKNERKRGLNLSKILLNIMSAIGIVGLHCNACQSRTDSTVSILLTFWCNDANLFSWQTLKC